MVVSAHELPAREVMVDVVVVGVMVVDAVMVSLEVMVGSDSGDSCGR